MGKGTSIQILGRPLLRDNSNSYISSTPPLGQETLTASSLINFENQTWREDIPQHFFVPQEILEIKKIPLLNVSNHGQILWKFLKHDTYSVRSAYHCLMDSVIQITHLKKIGDRMQVWNLQIPPKLQHFFMKNLEGMFVISKKIPNKRSPMLTWMSILSTFLENEWHLFFWFWTFQHVSCIFFWMQWNKICFCQIFLSLDEPVQAYNATLKICWKTIYYL